MTPTIPDKFGKHQFRYQKAEDGYVGIVVGQSKERFAGKTIDELRAKLCAHVMSQNAEFIGYDGAMRHFLRHFPKGFDDPEYIGVRERKEKLEAAKLLADTLPVEQAVSGTGMGEAVVNVFNAISFQLLAWQEKDVAIKMLRGADADAFVHAAARFCLGCERTDFTTLKTIAARSAADKWTVISYLPWLWQPGRHMFIKPDATKSFARRVGHSFQVVAEEDDAYATYLSGMDLAREVLEEVATIGPRDNIDVQGFIWVSERYPRIADL